MPGLVFQNCCTFSGKFFKGFQPPVIHKMRGAYGVGSALHLSPIEQSLMSSQYNDKALVKDGGFIQKSTDDSIVTKALKI